MTGTDIDEAMLAAADRFVTEEGLRNVALVKDDLFASELEPSSFDLVHARYEICPLGRGNEQMETYLRFARPGATIVLEDPDTGSWHFNPQAPALERLIALIKEAFRVSGGDWEAGRQHLHLLREFGIEGNVRAEVVALPPGASLPPPAAAIRDLAGGAAAVPGQCRRAAGRGRSGRGRAPRDRPLGHYVHTPAVLGAAMSATGHVRRPTR